MVADFEESAMLGEIQDLENEIDAISNAVGILETLKLPQFAEAYDKIIQPLTRTQERLKSLKYHKEMRLKIHRQRIKESGIKF